MNDFKDWKRNYSIHPYHLVYNHICLRCKGDEHYHDKKTDIHWTLCEGCLRETELGPFRLRLEPVGQYYE